MVRRFHNAGFAPDEIAFVVTIHVVRSFSVLAFAPGLFRLCGSPGVKKEDG